MKILKRYFLINTLFVISILLLSNCSTVSVSIAENKEQIQSIHKVAIIPFDFKGKENIGYEFANSLSIYFIQNNRIEIVERNKNQLDKIIQEQKFSRSGLIDEDTAAEMGKILGVDAILIGEGEAMTLGESKDIVNKFKLKLINVENGVIILGVIKNPGVEWTPGMVFKYIVGFTYIWNKSDLLVQSSHPDFISEVTVKKVLSAIGKVERKK
ncbi:MAG: hypothetical protein H7A24_14260 [Leptospiraceae bacterium]|nr:hypothetical protein [Leptospiraceae bacterium]MCP5513045.1 hypothetical protein [Leptospiraceae bacterium]